MKITILSCTDRPDSNAWNVAGELKPIYEELKAEAPLRTLSDFPLRDVAGGRYDDRIPSVDDFNRSVFSGDGLLMVVPEYNGGFPGILKLFIDYLPHPESFNQYPVALVGEAAGAFGALRPVEQLQNLLIYRKAYLYPERVFFPRIEDLLDGEGRLPDGPQRRRMRRQAAGFVDFVRKVGEK